MTAGCRIAQRLRERIAGDGSTESLAAWARRRRWNMVLTRFPDLSTARIIDLGGTVAFWEDSPVRPAHVTVINLDASYKKEASWADVVIGDACDASRVLEGRTYDIVFSNSTIEHVGGHNRCVAFADSVRQLAPRHWIQTPYRYFPIEPHFLFPGFQFLPISLRRHVAAHWPLSFTRSRGQALDDPTGTVLNVELLGRVQLRYYFPASEILSERILGVTKSIVAVVA